MSASFQYRFWWGSSKLNKDWGSIRRIPSQYSVKQLSNSKNLAWCRSLMLASEKFNSGDPPVQVKLQWLQQSPVAKSSGPAGKCSGLPTDHEFQGTNTLEPLLLDWVQKTYCNITPQHKSLLQHLHKKWKLPACHPSSVDLHPSPLGNLLPSLLDSQKP